MKKFLNFLISLFTTVICTAFFLFTGFLILRLLRRIIPEGNCEIICERDILLLPIAAIVFISLLIIGLKIGIEISRRLAIKFNTLNQTTDETPYLQNCWPRYYRWLIVLIVIVLLGSLADAYFSERNLDKTIIKNLKNKLSYLEGKLNEKNRILGENIPLESGNLLTGSYEVVIKPKEQYDPNDYGDVRRSVSSVDIYLKDLSTNEKIFFTNLDNIYYSHYHPAEFINNHLYIIERVGYNGNNDDWMDELWQYSVDRGYKLYSMQGLDFRVSPLENFIAVSDNDLIKILNIHGSLERSFSVNSLKLDANLDLQPSIISWSDDGNIFWGDVSAGMYIGNFFSIDTAKQYEVKRYKTPAKFSMDGYALNPNSGVLAYTDKPIFFDALEYQEWSKTGTITLYVKGLASKDQEKIVTKTKPGKITDFEAKWLDATTLEYTDPDNSEKRITYKLQ